MKRFPLSVGLLLLALVTSASCSSHTPPTITNVTITPSDHSAQILWTASEDSYCQIEYGLSTSYGETIEGVPSAGERLYLSGVHTYLGDLAANTTYHFRILSEDRAGRRASSEDYSFTTLADVTPPQATSWVTVSRSYGDVQLTWSANEEMDLAGYSIYRSGSPDSGFVRVNSDLVTVTSYSDSGLTPDTIYYYRITAIDSSGNESAKSEYWPVRTLSVP